MINDDSLMCFDIYCDSNKSMVDILSSIACENTNNVFLEFTPKDTSGCTTTVIDGVDETLFVLKGKENLFAQNKAMFPILSHA